MRHLVAAGAVLAAGVLICIERAPRPIPTTDGLSWFGVVRATVLEYGLTLLVTAALMLRAAAPLAAVPALRPARRGLTACAALLPAMVATPYTLNTALNWIHMTVGSVLFVVQLLLSAWLWWARARTPSVLALLVVEFLAGVVCFSSLIDLDAWMLHGQLVFQLAFAACVAVAIQSADPDVTSSVAGRSAARGHA